MAINRTNVGRQMVGDLGNFVGKDLRKQFMYGPQKLEYGPQKLAEGDSVAEEIAFETVSFTDDITGETKTFQFNPETHHPPDSTGRMRKKGVGSSDVARVGGVDFFDKAELVEQPAAPAGPAAPPKQKPPPPLNLPTDADEAEILEWQSQQSKPITERTAYEVGQTLPDAKLRYKQATYANPFIKGLTKGFVDVPPRDVLENYMGRGRTGYVQNLSGLNPDLNTAAPTLIEDTRRLGLGIPEDIVKQNIDYAYKTMAKKDKEGDVKKHLSPKEIDHLIAAGEMDFADLEGGPGVKELKRRDKEGLYAEKEGLSSLREEGDQPGRDRGYGGLSKIAPLTSQADQPGRDIGSSLLTPPEEPKTLARDLTASITPVKAENLPSITPRAKLQADTDKEAAQTKKEEEEAAAIKKAQSKLDPKTIKALKAMEKSANLLSIAKKRFDTGEGSLTKKEERDYQTSRDRLFPSMSQLSPEAYETEYSVSKYMPTREEMNKYEAFRAADDRIDWSEEGETDDFAGTIDTGSPFRQGGPVRLAGGGGLSSLKPPINPGDFVIASDVVSGIGDGSSQFGVERLTEELGVQPRPFSAALGGEVRGPGSGLDDLIQTTVRGKQAARLANQEFLVPRQDVMKIGKGSLKNGQEMLYALMDRVRKQKSGGQQPPRLQGSLAGLMGNMRS